MLSLIFDILIEKIEADCRLSLLDPVEPSGRYADLFDIHRWQCGNRITCSDTRQELSMIRVINRSDELVATIGCKCGFKFTVKRNKMGDFGKTRFKSVGSEVVKFLQERDCIPFYIISKRLRLSRSSYSRIARKLKGELMGNLH